MEQPEVFYTYEWARAVSRAYHAHLVPLLILGYDGDTLVGLVALAMNHSQETVFLTSTTADYCDFICHPERRPQFLNRVFTELRKQNTGILLLANLPADSASAHALTAAARTWGYSVFSRPAYSCSQVLIDSPANRKLARESAQRRLRRYAKTMGRENPAKFSHSTSQDEITAELPTFAKAHVARFLATGRISNLAWPERRIFLQELTQSLSPPGWAKLSRLVVGEQVVAWNYGFQFAGSWFWYQPTFATDFQHYSPGMWLLSKIVEESCENAALNRVDLGLGAEGYKERLATASRQTIHVTATTSTLRSWKERVRCHSASVVRSIPRMEAWVRAGMHRVSSVKNQVRREGVSFHLENFLRRCREVLGDRSEFCLLQWSELEFVRRQHPAAGALTVQPLDLDLLATAAMRYVQDAETLAYLLRAAARLRSGEHQGFALVTREGVPLHFCRVAKFEEFSDAEFKCSTKPRSLDCVLILDAWTPVAVRGRGHYCEAIARVASRLQAAGTSPWIVISAANGTALRGAEEAGFVRKLSWVRKRVLFMDRVFESPFSPIPTALVKASSAA